ncbi:TIGR04086 family membrane protein [Anoxybacillus tepidamans]|uniref:TIGR04086 family membrane protein n=1 Tax=Anoxybacteroides tepidamans TaxID=265948 RepID=UPI000489FEDD|nr:TIGR04086 family membrane protein [Anoxybacillus tepidamans]
MSRFGRAIIYGVATIFLLAFVISLVLSSLLKWTNISESSLTWVIFAGSVLSVFVGGFVAGGKGKERGWIVGGATSILFTLIVFLFQFLGLEQTFSAKQWIYHLAFLVAAMFGGIMGVNVSSTRGHTH